MNYTERERERDTQHLEIVRICVWIGMAQEWIYNMIVRLIVGHVKCGLTMAMAIVQCCCCCRLLTELLLLVK